jgi:hypothetical protein
MVFAAFYYSTARIATGVLSLAYTYSLEHNFLCKRVLEIYEEPHFLVNGRHINASQGHGSAYSKKESRLYRRCQS